MTHTLTICAIKTYLSDTWICLGWSSSSAGLKSGPVPLAMPQFTLKAFGELVPPLIRDSLLSVYEYHHKYTFM